MPWISKKALEEYDALAGHLKEAERVLRDNGFRSQWGSWRFDGGTEVLANSYVGIELRYAVREGRRAALQSVIDGFGLKYDSPDRLDADLRIAAEHNKQQETALAESKRVGKALNRLARRTKQ